MSQSVAGVPLRCCVLGATGFIGGQIARVMVERGWRVRGVRRRPDAVGAVGDLPIEWVAGDLADPASLVAAMRGCPLVFHAAGYYPQRARSLQETLRHGVLGMRNVLAAATVAEVKRLVYTSALSTIGRPSEPGRLANESDLYVPGSVQNPYFEVKWAMEMEAMRAVAQGLPVVTVIPTVVFGPGDVKPATGALLLRVAQKRLPVTTGGTLNVVDVRDVAAGELRAAEHGRPGRRYILGGHNIALEEALRVMAEAAGVRPPRVRASARTIRGLGRLGGLAGLEGAQHLQAIEHWQGLDDSRSRAELRLQPPRPFEETCRDALAWFREHGYLPAQ
jgi:dihydroflavonol-4-reductase